MCICRGEQCNQTPGDGIWHCAGRITVRHTGIDLERFHFSGVPVIARRRRILFVGRFVEKKGGEYLLRAYARLRNVVSDAELTMIGDGPLRKKFEQLAGELRIPVRFAGALTAAEVKKRSTRRAFSVCRVSRPPMGTPKVRMVLLERRHVACPL